MVNFAIPVSGMNAQQIQLSVVANNIANIHTKQFILSRVSFSANNAVIFSVEKLPRPGVNLEEQMVELLEASAFYQANANVIRRANDALGYLLDVCV